MLMIKKLRRHELLAETKSFAYQTLQKALAFDVTQLMLLELNKLREPDDPQFQIRPMAVNELRHYAQQPDLGLTGRDSDRLLENLDFCIGMFKGNRLLGYYWLGLDSIEGFHNRGGSIESGVAVSFPETMAFVYNTYLEPSLRGCGHYVQLVRGAGKFAQNALGVRYLISTKDWTKSAALQSCERQGCVPLGPVWHFGMGERQFTRASAIARSYGIRLGRQAIVRERGFVAGD